MNKRKNKSNGTYEELKVENQKSQQKVANDNDRFPKKK